MSRLPPPEQWTIHAHNEMELAELVEEHIDYIKRHADGSIRSVHLPMQFVRHYLQRDDGALPTLAAIATLPIVLADGDVLGEVCGLDRLRGIGFQIPQEVMAIVPCRKDCTPAKVARAMRFLTDDWLCDVQTDYAGKCNIIAAALTIIERSLLDQRPAYFVTAGRRGGGKTTTLTMLIVAVTGIMPAAAAWSKDDEERRKALISYLLEGVSYILWDNIPRGTHISCPHIEKSCTATFYADRKLGVSEIVQTSASTIHLFTGNNIGALGDLASRTLHVRLELDRVDPENRNFRHPDPIGWTEGNRAEILAALYTILLGNPQLDKPSDAPAKTRFKMWWRLVGSAVENAAKAVVERTSIAKHARTMDAKQVDFQTLFIAQEEDDEDAASLADVLEALRRQFGSGNFFKASDVAELINHPDTQKDRADAATLRDFLSPGDPRSTDVSAKTVGRRLKNHVGEPVKSGDRTLVLRTLRDRAGGGKAALSFFVEAVEADQHS
jgi:hypothetical protein